MKLDDPAKVILNVRIWKYISFETQKFELTINNCKASITIYYYMYIHHCPRFEEIASDTENNKILKVSIGAI